jgi:hypothetical protein
MARALLLTGVLSLIAVGLATHSPVRAAPKGWKLPDNAKQVGDDVFEIGSKQVGNRTLTGWAIIHKGLAAKPSGAGGGKGGGTTCYAFLSSGMKWRTVEPYVLDTAVEFWPGTDSDTIEATVAGAIAEWEDAASGAIDGSSINIMGSGAVGTISPAARAQIGVTYNGVNEVCFDAIAETNVIAVTIVWGYYSGPTFAREIVEWDQIYDDDGNWMWGTSAGGDALMDFESIAQHEIGHAVGLGHPGGCPDETMYAYGAPGEIKKRDLNAGDIAGVSKLY